MSFWDKDDPADRATSNDGIRESKRANQALRDYLLMGSARSLRKLLAGYKAGQLSPTRSWNTLSLWSSNYDWVARAARFDEIQHETALAEYASNWKDKIMGSTEVLGRLSEQGRVSIADFITIKLVPTALVIPVSKDDGEDEDGEAQISMGGEMVQVVELNLDAIKKNGHLIKSITNTKYGPRIELYDGQAALVNVGRHHKLFTDQQTVNGIIEHKGDPKENERFDRAISELAKAIGEILPGTGAEPDSKLGASQ